MTRMSAKQVSFLPLILSLVLPAAAGGSADENVAQAGDVAAARRNGQPASDADPVEIEPRMSHARRGESRNLCDLIQQADLVFRGVVQTIEYKLSDPAGLEQTRVPYTFVTFRVLDVVHGQAPGDTLTLRFIGGLNEERMSYLASSIAPQFDIGDEDLLLVQGNGQRMSPLVGKRSGRLRIIDGQVYTETGRAVHLSENCELEIGAQHRLPDVMLTTVAGGMMFLHRTFGARALDGPSDAVWADALVAEAKQLATGVATDRVFASAAIDQPLAGPDMTPAPPPALPPAAANETTVPPAPIRSQNGVKLPRNR